MAVKKVTYKEPSDYFTPSMRKAADEWEKANKKKQSAAKKSSTGKKK